MNIHPKRVHVLRGTYRPPSITVVLVGSRIVPTAWALNTLAVRAPLNCDFRVRAAVIEPDAGEGVETWPTTAALVDAWRSDPTGSSHLLVWPAGQYLAWNAITDGVKVDAARTHVGSAVLHCRRYANGDVLRPDLEATPDDAGHPTVADDPDPHVSPALSVVIGIPSLGRVGLVWAKHLMELAMPIGTAFYLVYVEGYEVGQAREEIVDRVLAMKPRPAFLLFLGDDNLPPSGTIQRLYDDLQAYPDVEAIGGLYHTKSDPSQAVAWNNDRTLREGVDYQPGDIMAVASMGLDTCLVRTSWLAKVPRPRFVTVQAVDRQNTEDCHLWATGRRATGRDPWLDTGVAVGHYSLRDGRIY